MLQFLKVKAVFCKKRNTFCFLSILWQLKVTFASYLCYLEWNVLLLNLSFPVDTKKSLQRFYDVAIQRRSDIAIYWHRYIVVMETSADVAKTTSLQHLIKRRHNETLQRRRFCKVVWWFHRNYMTTSEQRRNDVVTLFCLVESKYR